MTQSKISGSQMLNFLMLEAAAKDEEIRMLKLQIFALQNPEEVNENDDTVQTDELHE